MKLFAIRGQAGTAICLGLNGFRLDSSRIAHRIAWPRNIKDYCCSTLRFGANGQGPSEKTRPFFHPDNSQRALPGQFALRLLLKPFTVIAYGYGRLVGRELRDNVNSSRFRVFAHISQGFLDNAIYKEFLLLAKPPYRAVHLKGHIQTGLLSCPGSKVP